MKTLMSHLYTDYVQYLMIQPAAFKMKQSDSSGGSLIDGNDSSRRGRNLIKWVLMDLHSIMTAALTLLLMITDSGIQYVLLDGMIYQASTSHSLQSLWYFISLIANIM